MKRHKVLTRTGSQPPALNVYRYGSMLAAAFASVLGCAMPEGDESIDVEARPIVAVNQSQEFKYLQVNASPSNGVGDFGFCTAAIHSKITFTRDTSNFIQGMSDINGQGSPWAKYGSGANARQLGGRPACGVLGGSSNPVSFILVAKGLKTPDGKSFDRRLFWSKGSWSTTGTVNPPAPTAVTAFAAMDNTSYNVNGNPTVGTHNGQLVVAYLNDSGQLAVNYWKSSSNSFSGTLVHPNFPQGWVGVGSPAIAFAESWSGRFSIFVRAYNSATRQYRLYETFFATDHFTGLVPGNPPAFKLITLPANATVMDSDPAYEFDNYPNFNAGTLYYRTDINLYQLTATNGVDDFSNSVINQVTGAGSTPAVMGNPVVIGGTSYEGGNHWVTIRSTSNDLLFGESFKDDDLAPN